MRGVLFSLNVSTGGLPKRAVVEAELTPLGLVGDSCAHPQVHGGPDQALLIATREGIEELVSLGYPLFPGALGENITTDGIDRRQLRIGQRFRLGPEAIIEITKPRGPCSALDPYGPGLRKAIYDAEVKRASTQSPRWGLSGLYARVLRAGILRAGDPVWLMEQVV
jgi:MOSC domain-containing protein YiiM